MPFCFDKLKLSDLTTETSHKTKIKSANFHKRYRENILLLSDDSPFHDKIKKQNLSFEDCCFISIYYYA